jgi:hypothetical protein
MHTAGRATMLDGFILNLWSSFPFVQPRLALESGPAIHVLSTAPRFCSNTIFTFCVLMRLPGSELDSLQDWSTCRCHSCPQRNLNATEESVRLLQMSFR